MRPQNSWLIFLELLYISAFLFLLVTALATAYGLSHPKLGLVETNPLLRAYMSEYGLVGALLLAMLVNSSVLIFSGLFFTLYRTFQRRYHWHNPLTDSIAYSLVATFGLYALIALLLNAANDVSWLLFHSCPHLITATLRLWTNVAAYMLLAIFLSIFLMHTRGRVMHVF